MIDTETQKEPYFKELASAMVEAGSPPFRCLDPQAEPQGRADAIAGA